MQNKTLLVHTLWNLAVNNDKIEVVNCTSSAIPPLFNILISCTINARNEAANALSALAL